MLSRVSSLLYRLANARQPDEPLGRFGIRLLQRLDRRLAVRRNRITPEDIAAVAGVLRSGRIAFGPQVRSFQDAYARAYGAAHAVASSSGTAAVHVALAMIDIEPGDEVIVPPITDIGTILPVLYQNAVPVFADVRADTWTIDPDRVEEEISRRTKAIIAVHLFGNPCDMRRLRAIAERHGVCLIEDCAQAHMARYDGRPVGTLGHAGAFSLQWTKHITSCEGGMTITSDPQMAERGRLFADKGWNRGGSDARRYPMIGLNYRLSEMQAALGRSQLRRAPQLAAVRNRNARIFRDALSGVSGVTFQAVPESGWHSYWQLGVTVDADAPFTADALKHCLQREEVSCSAHYIGRPLHSCHDPLLERRVYGTSDFPFDASDRADSLDYRALRQPVAEDVLKRLVLIAVDERYPERVVRRLAAKTRDVVERMADPPRMQAKPRARWKLGVVGCGGISWQHLKALLRVPEIRVTAAADVDPEASRSLAGAFGIPSRYNGYEEMLEREDLDIVLVATWPTLHAPVSNLAAARGVRVILCEKPMASNLGEARAMLEAAERAKSCLVIGHQHRFNPHLEMARAMIAGGKIGAVQKARAHCAGSLINNGSHVIDGLLYLLGDPEAESLRGEVTRVPGQTNRGQAVEESSRGWVRLRNGVECEIEMGKQAVPAIGWHVTGERGSLDVEIGGVKVKSGRGGRATTLRRSRVLSAQDQFRSIVDYLQQPSRVPRGAAGGGYRALEILMGLLESARLGESLSLPITQMEYPLDLEWVTSGPVAVEGGKER